MIGEVAQVDEPRCIGCARCLPPCPFDAIIGAKTRMHTVLTQFCTGCELCVPACPVDCITMVPRQSITNVTPPPSARTNRERISAHHTRLERRSAERVALLSSRKRMAHVP